MPQNLFQYQNKIIYYATETTSMQHNTIIYYATEPTSVPH